MRADKQKKKKIFYEFAALTESELKTKYSNVFQPGIRYSFILTSMRSEPRSPDATF